MTLRFGNYRLWQSIFLVVSTLVLISCVTGPIHVDMHYAEGIARDSAEILPATNTCEITIDKVSDARRYKATLGSLGAQAVYGEDVESWVRRGLSDLHSFGYRVENADTTLSPAVRMDVSLKQAYVRSVNTSIESIVQLEIRYLIAGGTVSERRYRGSYIKVNWASAEQEVMDSLNHALGGAVIDIARDLPALCGLQGK